MPPRPADERGLRRPGPADLAAQVAAVAAQHRVLVVQGHQVPPGEREGGRPLGLDPHQRRDGQRLPGEQREVVGGTALAPGVQPAGPPGHRVVRPQVARLGVHHGHAAAGGAGGLGQRDGRVLGRDQQHRPEQGGHPVTAAGHQPHRGRRDAGRHPGGQHGRARAQHRHQRVSGQDLQRAGRPEVPVRVLGGEHGAGARVGDHVGGGGHGGQPPGVPGRVADHDAPAGEPRAADHRAAMRAGVMRAAVMPGAAVMSAGGQARAARQAAARCGAARHGAARHGAARHGAARHGDARHRGPEGQGGRRRGRHDDPQGRARPRAAGPAAAAAGRGGPPVQ